MLIHALLAPSAAADNGPKLLFRLALERLLLTVDDELFAPQLDLDVRPTGQEILLFRDKEGTTVTPFDAANWPLPLPPPTTDFCFRFLVWMPSLRILGGRSTCRIKKKFYNTYAKIHMARATEKK
uniref:Secreted protein n=1 Tax=Romanomermis culicivorax TaxID=13658 RepID=A0A915KXM3_ROMCU